MSSNTNPPRPSASDPQLLHAATALPGAVEIVDIRELLDHIPVLSTIGGYTNQQQYAPFTLGQSQMRNNFGILRVIPPQAMESATATIQSIFDHNDRVSTILTGNSSPDSQQFDTTATMRQFVDLQGGRGSNLRPSYAQHRATSDPTTYHPYLSPDSGPSSPPIMHKVYRLSCASCGNFFTNRGMKVCLLRLIQTRPRTY